MWDDLNPTNNQCNQYCAGEVYYQQFADKFVVTFDGVAHWWTNFENTFYTFQMVLNSDGRVELNYYDMVGEVNSATIGIQGGSDSDYVMLSFNNTYAENNLSANIFPAAEWLSVTPRTGIIPPGGNEIINVDIDTEGLLEGIYLSLIHI